MKKHIIYIVLLMLGMTANAQFGLPSSAPIVTGNNAVTVNTTHIYEGYPPFGVTINAAHWTVTGGTIQSQSTTQVTIVWNTVGTNKITYHVTNSSAGKMKGTLDVVVSAATVPVNPPNPTIIAQTCTTATLQKAGSIPSGQMWYWQTSANSTDINYPATSNYVATSASSGNVTYWIRALDTSNNIWSTGAGQVTVNYGTTGGLTYYQDQDGDGLGDPNSTPLVQCSQPTGYVDNNYDQCPNIYGDAVNGGCPSTNPFSNENYIHTLIPQVETTNISSLLADQKLENITYFDGLGRAKQSIAIKQNPLGNDIVTHIEYDAFGRQTKEYLAYASTENNGLIKTNAELKTREYYQNNYASDFTGMALADINPYSEKVLENSPLSRIHEQTAPGKAWKKTTTNVTGKLYSTAPSIKFEYHTNTGAEVKHFMATTSYSSTEKLYVPGLSVSTVNSGYYKEERLIKTITKDENWQSSDGLNHTTEEFKDKQGRVVLKRTYDNSVAHDTYYVYDDYGNLSYVIPPLVNVSDGVNGTELSELCYQYKYDHRNRLVEKKIPGKGWESIVYDSLDRPILTQDALQDSANEWLFTKYDALGRVAYTGLMSSTSSRVSLQNSANTASSKHVTRQTGSQTIAGTTMYYNNAAYPTTGIQKIYTINYYDNYVSLSLSGFTAPTSVFGKAVTTNTKGLPTVSQVRVLTTNDWITTLSYYDNKGQAIYSYSENPYLGTTDIVKSELDFTGKVLQTESLHTNSNDPSLGTQTIREYYEYDAVGRLTKHRHKINSQAEEVLAENSYDELGQLESKGVGGTTTQSRLQNVDYTYNVRGWLKQINDPNTSLGNDLFAFGISYNDATHINNISLYNGNISETIWKTANDNERRTYGYKYDALNRIVEAIDRAPSFSYRYEIRNVSYDKNGNLLTLTRNGFNNNNYANMDILSYGYDSGNKLLSVNDSGYDDYGFKDGANLTIEYSYDANGNMTEDKNKGITSISYNHLNLPIQVSINGSAGVGTISYIYDATGVKLKKEVSTGATTEYAGNYVYEDGSLKFFNHAEGYVDTSGSGFEYVYQYKDHLGNVRLSYKDNGSVQIANDSFDSGIDGWLYGGVGGIVNDNGRLKVTTLNKWQGAFKISGNIINGAGGTVEITATVDKGNQDKVNVVIFERDASNNTLKTVLLGLAENGLYNTTYTIDNANTVKVGVKFEKPGTTTQEGQSTYFFIDDVSIVYRDLQIQEENNYYPFGLKHKGYNNVVTGTDHPYGFGGKEENDELGLGWHDFDARNYDAALGRWMNLDPLAEQGRRWSPYNYVFNNPIYFQDPDGMWPWPSWAVVKSFVKNLQQKGSNLTTRTSKAVDRVTQPARDLTQKASDVITDVSQTVTEMSSGAINEHIETSKALYTVLGQMGGQGLGLTSGLKVVTGKTANVVDNVVSSTDETVVVIGQKMERVHEAKDALLKSGVVENVEVFTPSTQAVEEFTTLINGLEKGERLSDKVVKGTKLYKENVKWIKNAKESGKTIIDIGKDGSGKTSTFYEMEKTTIYGNQ